MERQLRSGAWLGLDFSPLSGEGEAYAILVVARDISERKRAELGARRRFGSWPKRSTGSLVRDEEQRLLLRHAPAAIYEVDLRLPAFVSVNDWMCQWTGYSREELLALDPLEILDEEGRRRFRRWIGSALAGEKTGATLGHTVVTKAGERRTAVLNVALACEHGKPARALVVAHDVSEAKRAHDRLRQTEEKYRTVVENIQEGLVVMAGEQVLYRNGRVLEALGYKAEEYAAMNFLDHVHPDDRVKVARRISRVLKTGRPVVGIEFRVVTRTGAVEWLSARASLIQWDRQPAVIAFLESITERKAARLQLVESEARFRRIADVAGAGIFMLGQDGKISYVNRTCADIFGYAPEEVVGRLSHRELIHPDDAERAADRIARRLAGEVDDENVVFKGLKKDGSLVYVELRGQFVDFDGKPSVLGTLIDVTERQRVAAELEASERRYRTVVDNIQEGVIVASATKKLYYNERMARMHGFTPQEYGQVSFKSLVHPDDLAENDRAARGDLRDRSADVGLRLPGR